MCTFTTSHTGTNWYPCRQFQLRHQGLTGGERCVFGEGRDTLAGGRVKSLSDTVLSAVWGNKIAIVDTSLISIENHNYHYQKEIRKPTWIPALSPEMVSSEAS